MEENKWNYIELSLALMLPTLIRKYNKTKAHEYKNYCNW